MRNSPAIPTRVDNLDWQRPRLIRQVARWHAENEIRMDADAVGADFPAIGGTYEMMSGPRNGTVAISSKADGTYLFEFHEVHNGVIHVEYKGTGRWLGPTLKVDFKDKHREPRQYSVAGLKPGDMLVEPYVPERLVRKRAQPAAAAQEGSPPEAQPGRRRRD